LKNEDVLDIFIKHVIDDSALIKNGVPTESIETNLNANSLGVDIGGSYLNDSNIDEDLEGIPDKDDRDVDEELRGFIEKLRHEKREEQKKKEKSVTQEIELTERKTDRYIGKLAGDEEYLDSSDVGSDDSKDGLDSQA
ncbi:hypothetical protein HAX54_011852, partial [Datura stramonium]|nr:hypothetical protein [Datura stramonium]